MNTKRTEDIPTWTRRNSYRSYREVKVDKNGQFHWRHLVIVAAVTGLFQGVVCFACVVYYVTQIRFECRLAAVRAEEALKDNFRTHFQSSAPRDLSSAYELSSASDLSSASELLLHVNDSVLMADDDFRHASSSRMRRQSTGNRTRNTETRSTNGPRKNGTNSNKSKTTNREQPFNAAAGIHLELSVPTLEQHVLDRLRSVNKSSETVDYGQIYDYGFKPYADRTNDSARYSFRNWIPAKWFNKSSTVFQYDSKRGMINILLPGLYYVYSQIRFYHTRPWSYALMRNEDILFKCIDGTNGQQPLWQFSNCYVGGITAIARGDRIWIQDMYGETSEFYDYYVHLDPDSLGASSYWGAVRLGHL